MSPRMLTDDDPSDLPDLPEPDGALAEPPAASRECPHCGAHLDGLFLPNGTTIDDLGLIYEFVGTIRLGSATKGNRGRPDEGRGEGSAARGRGNNQRAGRTQRRERRAGEHA